MAEYIEREFAIKQFEEWAGESKYAWVKSVKRKLQQIPAADVRSERYGKWIVEAPNAIGFFPVKCSNCGIKIATTGDPCDWVNAPDHLYCGACGAKMGRKGEE